MKGTGARVGRSGYRSLAAVAGMAMALLAGAGASAARADTAGGPVLARENILIAPVGVRPCPTQQVVPRNIATIVTPLLELSAATPGDPDVCPEVSAVPQGLPDLPADALVFGVLRGPAFSEPVKLAARPNEPFKIPPLALTGRYFVQDIHVESGGATILQASPDTVTLDVIDKILVSQVTSRPLTAEEIRQKGIFIDQTNYDVINFTAAFGIVGNQVFIDFPMIVPKGAGGSIPASPAPPSLPALQPAAAVPPLQALPQLQQAFKTPNVSISGLLLKIEDEDVERQFSIPPIPGVIIIPGNIAYLHQFFSVMLMVSNVAPGNSRLVVRDVHARIVLPNGTDTVPDTGDDPLQMARLGNPPRAQPKVQPVVQPGRDGKLGTADDIGPLTPGSSGDAEYLVEGRKEGTHAVQMEITGTLDGLPIGPVAIKGFATGIVEVRNPSFALTLSHPATITAGEEYDFLVTLTNTSDITANLLSLSLLKRSISGADLLSDESVPIPTLAGRDAATVAFRMRSKQTGTVTSTSFTSDDVPGKFELHMAVGANGIPMSPNTLVLPATANSLPTALHDAGIGLLGQAFALATSPVTPKGLLPITQQIVYERATDLSQSGQRAGMQEPLASVARDLVLDFTGNGFTRIAERFDAGDASRRALVEADYRGFDELLRQSNRGGTFLQVLAGILSEDVGAQGALGFLDRWGRASASRPSQIAAITGSGSGAAPVVLGLLDKNGKRLGLTAAGGVVARQIPFGNFLSLIDARPNFAQMAIVSAPAAGAFTVEVTATGSGVFDLGVLVPEGSALRRLAWQGVPVATGAKGRVAIVKGGSGPYELALDDNNDGAVDRRVPPGASDILPDEGPALVNAIQVVSGGPDLSQFGQMIGLLFSEEISKASSQSDLEAQALTHYGVDDNMVAGGSLQPGGRVMLLALRDGIGPFVTRNATVSGIEDRLGHPMAPAIVTVPIVPTITNQGGTISGRVLRGDGSAVPQARLKLSQKAPVAVPNGALAGLGDLAPEKEVTVTVKDTGADGKYAFDYVRIFGLPNEFVRFEAVDPESGERGLVTTALRHAGQHLDLDIILLGTGRLVGRTLAPDGTPLPGAVVRVTSLTRYGETSGAVADASGAYSISGIPVGNITIEAAHVATNSKVLAASVIPAAGATVFQDLTLIPVGEIQLRTGTLKGQVFRSDGTSPAPDMPVFTDRGGFATSDATGAYRIEGLPEGPVTVRAIDQARLEQGTVATTIVGGTEITANLLLFGGTGTVRGVVLDSDGTPVSGVVVGGGLSLATTDVHGEFILPDVPLGRRTITALDEARQLPGSVDVNLTLPGEDVHVQIILEARGAIAGRVFGADGTTPVAGLKVFLLGPRNLIGVTDANGGYAFQRIPVGTYMVSAFRPGFSDGNVVTTKLVFRDEVRTANVVFRGRGRVNGIILAADGRTPLGARVGLSEIQVKVGVLKPPENTECLGDIEVGDVKIELPKCEEVGVGFGTVPLTRIIDNDVSSGTFAFENLFVGEFTVQAANGFSPVIMTAAGRIVNPGDTAQVRLQLVATGDVSGTVFQPDGTTPVGEDVIVTFNSSTLRDVNVVTDPQGRYHYPLVNAGSFTVAAEDPAGGLVGQSAGAVDSGSVADIPIRLLGQGTVSVTVAGSNGPVARAEVTLKQGSFPGLARHGLSDASGAIAFEGGDAITEGPFSVSAFDPATGVSGFASGVIGAPDGHADVHVVLPDESGTVRGRFLKTDGTTGVSDAQVVLMAPGGDAFATSGTDGGFVFEGVLKGGFSLEAFDARTARRGKSSGQISANHDDVTADIVEVPQGTVKGFVRLDKDGSPVAAADVTISVQSLFGQNLLSTSGVDGSFTFPAVSAGGFTLSASDPRTGFSGSATGSLATEGQEVRLDIAVVVPAKGRVEGSVTRADGGPAIGAQVLFGGRTTTVDNVGFYFFDGVPLGPLSLLAIAPIPPDAGTGSGAIAFDGDVERVDIQLVGTGRVTGTVRNGAGDSVPFARVGITRKSSSPRPFSAETQTDLDGRFAFPAVPVGEVSVTATQSVTVLAGSASGSLPTAGATLDLTVTLQPSGEMRGRVLRENGTTPAALMALELVDGSTRFGSTAVDGAFRFPDLSLGTYRLTVTDPIGTGLARASATLAAQGQVVDLGPIILDESPPHVISIAPADGSSGVPVGQPIAVLFSEPVDPDTVTTANLIVSGAGGVIAGAWGASADRTAATFTPASPYHDFARISVKVTKAVQDRVGKALAAEAVSSFTTADSTPPSIVSYSPAAGARDVPLESVVRISYSEAVDPARFTGPAVVVKRGGVPVAGRIDLILSNTVAVFTPDPPLQVNGTYQVSVLPAADVFGNLQPQGLTFSFVTLDTIPPVIAALSVPGGTTVPEGATASIEIDLGATADIAFVEFFVNGSLFQTISSAPFTFRLAVTAALGPTVVISARATDLSGNVGPAALLTLHVQSDARPAASIVSPASGGSVNTGTTVTVQTHATDDRGVAQVLFQASGAATYSQTDTVDPAALSRDSTFVLAVPSDATPGGAIALKVVAVDTRGQHSDVASAALVVADLVPPSIRIASPADGLRVGPGDTVSVVVAASDNGVVSSVSLQASGAATFFETRPITPPARTIETTFQVLVPATAAINSTVTLLAHAQDSAGNGSDAPPITLVVRRLVPPTVKMTSPSNDASIIEGTTLTLGVDAGDDAGVARVEFFIDGATAGIDTEAPYSVKRVLGPGAGGSAVRIEAVATDTDGLTATDSVTITRLDDITPPVVSLGAPADGAHLPAGPGDVAILIDVTSGAPAGGDVDGDGAPDSVLKAEVFAARAFLASLDSSLTQVAVVRVADSGASVIQTLTGDYNLVGAALEGLLAAGPSGGIPDYSAALRSGTGEVTGPRARRDALPVQVLLSKGSGSSPADEIVRAADGGVVVHTLAVGSSADPVVLQQIAAGTGGTPVTLPDVTRIDADLAGVFLAGSSRVSIVALASDDVAVRQVEFSVRSVDGSINLSFTDTQPPFQALLAPPLVTAPLDLTIAAAATDYGGNRTASDTRTITLAPNDTSPHIVRVDPSSGPIGRVVSIAGRFFDPVATNDAVSFNGAPGVVTGASKILLMAAVPTGATDGPVVVQTGGGTSNGVAFTVEVSQLLSSVVGRVLAPDGQTGVPDLLVRLYGTTVAANAQANSGPDGGFRFDNLAAGAYELYANGSNGRPRAHETGIIVPAGGQIVTRDLTLVALGTVRGQILDPGGVPDPGLYVVLRSDNPVAGGYFTTYADADGRFELTEVPVGSFTVSSSDATRRLLGEASGRLEQDGQVVVADVHLLNNAINLPTTLKDENELPFDVQPNGSLQYGYYPVFAGDFGARSGALLLDVVADGTANRYTGGGVGTVEGNGREIVTPTQTLAGLEVSRKVFVPADGYFVRYLETLGNPTTQPITVDVRVSSHVGSNGYGTSLITTSSGDAVFDVSDPGNFDRWLMVDDSRDIDPFYDSPRSIPAVAFAFDGPGAVERAGSASLVSSGPITDIVYQWSSVTVPPGGAVSFLHFGVQEIRRAGARAAAERLMQLPPEALAGLSPDETARIPNFSVPADGTSALAPLPPLDGKISGRLLALDGVTLVTNNWNSPEITIRSSNVLFGRTYYSYPGNDGVFSLDGAIGGSRPIAVPVDDFTINVIDYEANVTASRTGTFPGPDTFTGNLAFLLGRAAASSSLNGLPPVRAIDGDLNTSWSTGNGEAANQGSSPYVEMTFPVDALVTQVNIRGNRRFARGHEILRGRIELFDASGQVLQSVEAVLPDPSNDADVAVPDQPGVRRVRFTSLDDRSVNPALSEIEVLGSSAVPAPANGARLDVVFSNTGMVKGIVRRPDGTPATAGYVEARRDSSADVSGPIASDGTYAIANLPTGLFDVSATITTSQGARLSSQKVSTRVVRGRVTSLDLVTPPTGALAGTVFDGVGAPAPGIKVEAVGPVYRTMNTDGSGRFDFEDLPPGGYLLRATEPNTKLLSSLNVTVGENQATQQDLTLVGFGTVQVQVFDSGGSPASSIQVNILDGRKPALQFGGFTDVDGALAIRNVPVGSFTVYAYRRDLFQAYTSFTGAIPAHGAVIPATLVLPGLGVVTGRVSFANGTAAASSTMILSGTDVATQQTRTDSLGDYTFVKVPTGRPFDVQALDPTAPQRYRTATGKLIASDGGTLTVDLTLPATATVRVTVLRADATPFAQAEIYWQDSFSSIHGSPYRFQGYTDGNGVLSIPGVAEGSFVVVARDPASGVLAGNVRGAVAQADNGATIDVTIHASPVGTIQGTVFAADGRTPVPYATLRISADGFINAFVYADGSGAYQAPGIASLGQGFTVRAIWPGDTSLFVERSGAFSANDETITLDLPLPISVVRGVVSFTDGSPVASAPIAIAKKVASGSGQIYFYGQTDDAGAYLALGIPAGDFIVSASDATSGLNGSVIGTVSDISIPVTANLSMQPSGTVTGTVKDAAGAPVAAAGVALSASSLSIVHMVTADDLGVYSVAHVPLGPLSIQVQQPGTGITGAAAGTLLTDRQVLTLDVTLPQTGSVRGTIFRPDGMTPVPGATVTLESLANGGPLGAFRATTTADASGVYQMSGIPIGALRVTAADPANPGLEGVAQGTLVAGVTASIDVLFGNVFQFDGSAPTYNLDGTDGFRYDVDCLGFLSDGGTADRRLTNAWDEAYRLLVNNRTGACPAGPVPLEQNGRQIVFGPWPSESLMVTRKIFVPAAGGFVRFLDSVTNPTSQSRSGQIAILSDLGSDSLTRLVVSPSSTGTFAVTDNGGTCCSPALAHVFSGFEPLLPPSGTQFYDGYDQIYYSWSFTIPPGATYSFLHFAVQRDFSDATGARSEAEALVNLSDPEALDGISPEERSQILNFIVPLQAMSKRQPHLDAGPASDPKPRPRGGGQVSGTVASPTAGLPASASQKP